MKIAVFGTGAVGGYFGGRLAQSGKEVIFVARGKHLQAIKKNGLIVESTKGDFIVHPVQITDNPEEIGIVDLVLVCVKGWQVPGAAQEIKSMVGPQTIVVPLQNGIDAPSQLSHELGEEHVLGGLCGLVSYITKPGHICHAGADPFISFGELDHHKSDRVDWLCKTFKNTTGIEVIIPPDIHVAMWRKFLFIAGWGGLGAVTHTPIGILRSQPGTRRLMEGTIVEIYNVARALNIQLSADSVAETMKNIDAAPMDATSSMQRDIRAGKPSELETQNGTVVRLGRQAGIKTTVNDFIYNCLLPTEMRARGQLAF